MTQFLTDLVSVIIRPWRYFQYARGDGWIITLNLK